MLRGQTSTFVGFKRAYDSIDREILFNIIIETGVGEELLIMRTILTDAKSRGKLHGCPFEQFDVQTEIWQRDKLSPISSVVLEKLIKEWHQVLKKKDLFN